MNDIHDNTEPAATNANSGAAARRAREFQQREDHILETALSLIAEQSYLGTSMATLAQRAGYATGTLYKHFDTKEDLLLALTARSNAKRAALMQRVAGWDASSRDRMMGIGYSDLLFVANHPIHFRLEQLATAEDIWSRCAESRRMSVMQTGAPCSRAVEQIVQDAVDNGDLALATLAVQEVAVGLWTMSLGTHTLVHAAGVLDHHDIHQPYALLGRNYTLYLNALGWAPLVDPDDRSYRQSLRTRLHAELFPDYEPPSPELID